MVKKEEDDEVSDTTADANEKHVLVNKIFTESFL